MISVTQVLQPFTDLSRIPGHVLDHAADRGTRVHKTCEDYAKDQDLWVMVDDDCRGYFQSFKDWFDGTVEEVTAVETELVDPNIGLVGHADLICRVKGDTRLTVVDFKTPVAISKTWAGQLAAYWYLATLAGYDVARAGTLRLSPEGRAAKFDEVTDLPRALKVYFGALEAYREYVEKT